MNNKPKRTLEEVLKAIKGSFGIKGTIAKRLDVHRETVNSYLNCWATAKAAYQEEVEAVGDLAEGVIIADIAHNVETAKWYARMKLKDRGYVERQEVSGPGGESLVINIVRKDS